MWLIYGMLNQVQRSQVANQFDGDALLRQSPLSFIYEIGINGSVVCRKPYSQWGKDANPCDTINVGRATSNGVFGGMFGNPYPVQNGDKKASVDAYRVYFRNRVSDPYFVEGLRWLWTQMKKGKTLYCPGCGTGNECCHARVIEEEIASLCELGLEKYKEALCGTK